MQYAVIGIVAQFYVEIIEVIEQKNGFFFIPIGQHIARKIECIELLLYGELGKMGGCHGAKLRNLQHNPLPGFSSPINSFDNSDVAQALFARY